MKSRNIKSIIKKPTVLIIVGISLFLASCTNKTLGCKEIQSWKNEGDIIKSLQGTWEMDHAEYYGKRRFQFSGRSGRCWVMRPGAKEWVDDGAITFDYYQAYDHHTKRNFGTEYYISYKGAIGYFRFEADCIIGLAVLGDGRLEYGMAMHKID